MGTIGNWVHRNKVWTNSFKFQLSFGMKSNYGFQEKIPNGYLLYQRSIKHILSNNNIVNRGIIARYRAS